MWLASSARKLNFNQIIWIIEISKVNGNASLVLPEIRWWEKVWIGTRSTIKLLLKLKNNKTTFKTKLSIKIRTSHSFDVSKEEI